MSEYAVVVALCTLAGGFWNALFVVVGLGPYQAALLLLVAVLAAFAIWATLKSTKPPQNPNAPKFHE